MEERKIRPQALTVANLCPHTVVQSGKKDVRIDVLLTCVHTASFCINTVLILIQKAREWTDSCIKNNDVQ